MPDTTPSRPAMTMREIRDRLGHARPDTTPTTAESILGPITPIRCTEPGCHWSCHGVPEKYTESRARIVAGHMADEHAPQPEPVPAAAPFRYVDEDGFCLSARLLPDLNAGGTTDMLSITIEGSDEPQSAHVPVGDLPQVLAGIATTAGVVLGTTDQQPETAPADRRARYAAAIREADGWVLDDGQHMLNAVMALADGEQAELRAEVKRLRVDRDRWQRGHETAESQLVRERRENDDLRDQLRRMADEAQQSEPATDDRPHMAPLAVPCPACKAPVGQLCTSHGGTRTRRSDVHQARTAAYRDQTATTEDVTR